jgi:hypothetical protein
MLTVYFDDSGTHDTSDVVVWAGLFGNQFQWDYFSQLWAKKLAESSPGKAAIKCFHMYDCQNASEEFAGWSRTATDFLVYELTDILLKTGIWGYGSAVSRKDWEELIKGDILALNGDAEGQCIRNVYVRSIQWAEECGGQPHIAYIFDERPHRAKENGLIFEIFRSLHEDEAIKPQPVSLNFGLSSAVLPLQAADLFAWETYQHANDVIKRGQKLFEFRRETLKRLTD